ncbi:hypothetical protein D9757_002603 [Collybiopsis confluens]|uniref:LamB/YcsF family protein n=1 Tax=Collybiopsis confluens TaxID=2823264 RepID=A0A8H5MEH4_9AGAR|nr:hypothetical protein D9757_002603 [Collybiopsis confluens]
MVLKATVNCDLGEADDEALMKTIHLANIACGGHAGDFATMNKSVRWAKEHGVLVGAHPSLLIARALVDDELVACFVSQVGSLCGFLRMHGLQLNHIKPHGAIYGQMARSDDLARAAVMVCKIFSDSDHQVAFVGLAGTAHQRAAEELGIRFIPEWFADLEYSPSGQLLITQVHASVTHDNIRARVIAILSTRVLTLMESSGANIREVTICCHSDTPGAVGNAQLVKSLVDESNRVAGF